MDYNNSISFNNNVCSNNNTNLLNKYKNQPNTNFQAGDTVILDKDLIASLHYCKDYAAVGTVCEGSINNKSATLKIVSNDNKDTWLEGVINKKYFLMHSNNEKYDGKYGDSEFNLTIDYNEPSKLSTFFNQKLLGKAHIPDYFNIKGSIGNKNIDITLPNIKIPQDEELKDILCIILEDKGLKAQTINGEVKSLRFSYSAIKNLKKRAEKREQTLNNDIKPIFMQGISTATGLVIGSVVSAMLFKFGLKK